jgi:hypothetical protein
MTRYFASLHTKRQMLYRDVPGSLGVLSAPDGLMPIGQADCVTHDENGAAVWVLRVGKQEIPGRWVLVDGEIRSVE